MEASEGFSQDRPLAWPITGVKSFGLARRLTYGGPTCPLSSGVAGFYVYMASRYDLPPIGRCNLVSTDDNALGRWGMAIALFSIAIAAFSAFALGMAEAEGALGILSFLGLCLTKRVLCDKRA